MAARVAQVFVFSFVIMSFHACSSSARYGKDKEFKSSDHFKNLALQEDALAFELVSINFD